MPNLSESLLQGISDKLDKLLGRRFWLFSGILLTDLQGKQMS